MRSLARAVLRTLSDHFPHHHHHHRLHHHHHTIVGQGATGPAQFKERIPEEEIGNCQKQGRLRSRHELQQSTSLLKIFDSLGEKATEDHPYAPPTWAPFLTCLYFIELLLTQTVLCRRGGIRWNRERGRWRFPIRYFSGQEPDQEPVVQSFRVPSFWQGG